ncbi:MAG: class I SAM-dependent RNA methyltransferase [Thermodesulfovibrionales bacterium]|nr:class I SAM-dependent RNA methyltransferase [Thermodesulfovibrionales bacterium]
MSLIIKAQAPVYGGYAIARDSRFDSQPGGVVFIKGAIPDEIVEISISKKKRDYSIGAVTNVIETSPYRINPPCSVFGACGGCHFQFISYERQVSMKEEILLDSVRRIGKMEAQLSPALTDRDYNYRYRGQFKVSQKGEIGFYKEGTREVVPIEECPLMIKEINRIVRELNNRKLSGIKEIHISCGDAVNALIKSKLAPENIEGIINGAGFSGIAFETGGSTGRDYIRLDLNGLQYTVTPWSFFQAHWDLNRKVVELIVNELQPLECLKVLDLYAGAGNFSLPLALYASTVAAVEENSYAIEDGQRNAKLNNIKNCKFIKSSAEKFRGHEKFDVIILDPPRPGLTGDVMKKVIDLSPKKIVYISCNPATLARDLKRLSEKYNLDSLRMIDFFPNTYHVEALAFMSLR